MLIIININNYSWKLMNTTFHTRHKFNTPLAAFTWFSLVTGDKPADCNAEKKLSNIKIIINLFFLIIIYLGCPEAMAK